MFGDGEEKKKKKDVEFLQIKLCFFNIPGMNQGLNVM